MIRALIANTKNNERPSWSSSVLLLCCSKQDASFSVFSRCFPHLFQSTSCTLSKSWPFKMDWNTSHNALYALHAREYSNIFPSTRHSTYFPNSNTSQPIQTIIPSHSIIKRLRPYCELRGHEGCVNRLDWNSSGDLLASCSDDTTICLWKPLPYYYFDSLEPNQEINRSGRRTRQSLLEQFMRRQGEESDPPPPPSG